MSSTPHQGHMTAALRWSSQPTQKHLRATSLKMEHRTATLAVSSILTCFSDIFAGFTFRCFQGHSRPASGQPSVSSHPMRGPVIGAPWPCPLLSTFKLTGEMPGQTHSSFFYRFLVHFCSWFPFVYRTTSQQSCKTSDWCVRFIIVLTDHSIFQVVKFIYVAHNHKFKHLYNLQSLQLYNLCSIWHPISLDHAFR